MRVALDRGINCEVDFANAKVALARGAGLLRRLQRIATAEERRGAALICTAQIQTPITALNAIGFEPEIVSGSGTGTCGFDAAF